MTITTIIVISVIVFLFVAAGFALRAVAKAEKNFDCDPDTCDPEYCERPHAPHIHKSGGP